jgi:PAS domain S-box-containing protein
VAGLWRRLAAAIRGEPADGGVLDTALDAFVSIDRQGHVVEWNTAAERILGWHRDEVIGRELAEVVLPPRFRDAHRSGLSRYLRTGEAHVLDHKLDLPAWHREGREFPAEVTVWRRDTPGGDIRFHAFLRDVSEQQRLRTHLAVLQRVTAMSNAANDIEHVVRSAMEEVSDLTGWPVGHTYLMGESGLLEPTGWWTSESVPYAAFRAMTEGLDFRADEGLPGRVAATREPVWIEGFSTDRSMHRAEAASHAGLHHGFAFPVLVGDRVVGVMEYFAAEMQRPEDDVVGLLRNIGTQLGRAFERVRSTEAVAQASELKSRLLSVVSHDLQAPLVSIEGFARLLEEDWDDLGDERKLAYLGRIIRQTERVDRLVKDLVTMSRLEAGRLTPDPVVVPLAQAVSDDARDLELDGVAVHIPERVRAVVDRHHLARIVTNLLTNAAKYGAPPIDVTGVIVDDTVVLRVRDHGPGVPEEFVPDLFRRFTRAAHDSRGSGLGLSIVAGLVAANGGAIRYEPGDPGASFAVTLPLAS